MLMVVTPVVLALLGLVFGSFVNALVWRLHEQAKLRGKKGNVAAKRREALSIAKGRSMCPHCGHELAAKDLVPVVSWLLLGGKCRYCKARIPDSPLVELLTAVLFVVSYLAWPYSMHGVWLAQFVFWLGFLVAFVALAVYDLRWFLLPDRIVFPAICMATIEVIMTSIWQRSLDDLWLPAAGAVVLAGCFWCLYQFSKGKWIGGGDVKLAIVLGLLAGTPFRALTVLFFASLIGTLVSVPELLKGRQGLVRRIPFGPPLLLATVIVVLWGTHIANWYQGLIIR